MICSEALVSTPSDMKDKTFQLQIKGVCHHKKIQRDKVRKWCYILKDEAKPLYHQTVYSEEEEDINEQ